MPKVAAGLILFRRGPQSPEVLLVHMGGPFWARKDLGAWSIPKGEVVPGEELLAGARREFREETGLDPVGTPFALGQVKQSGGKVRPRLGARGRLRSGVAHEQHVLGRIPQGLRSVPRLSRGGSRGVVHLLAEARRRLITAQVPLLDVLEAAPQFRAAVDR